MHFYKTTLEINKLSLTKITIRVIESLGHLKIFLDDLPRSSKWINNQVVP